MISVQEQDFSVADEYQTLKQNNHNCGAIAMFTGLVRDYYSATEKQQAELVTYLQLEHYPQMTEKNIQLIAEEAKSRFDINDLRIIHRYGKMAINEQIVFVGVAAKHRKMAFTCCDYVMDYLKSKAIFWKKEIRQSQSSWIEPTDADKAALETWEQLKK